MDGEIMAHEVSHSIKEYTIFPCVIKLDMLNSYNRINWPFLKKVLVKFRFSQKRYKWVMNILGGAHFSIYS